MARKILLADDSVTAQNMGRKILTDAGYEVVAVNNGSAALKKILEQKPDLIVLDVYMPGYSGLEVCQRIKENRDTARIPILLTVGKLEPFKPEEARRARADAFVVKPFEASELISALTKLEEKIGPQPEPYKPGRFAKAVAALDGTEASGEKFGDSDSGWKSRIRFPGRKKKEVEPEEAPETAAPAKAFRDLRDEPAPAPRQSSATPDFERPMPAGIPRDITPEEIAAISAAAAQLNGQPPVENSGSKSEAEAESKSEAQPEANQTTPAPELATAAAGELQPLPELPVAPPEAHFDSESAPITFASAPVVIEEKLQEAPLEKSGVTDTASAGDTHTELAPVVGESPISETASAAVPAESSAPALADAIPSEPVNVAEIGATSVEVSAVEASAPSLPELTAPTLAPGQPQSSDSPAPVSQAGETAESPQPEIPSVISQSSATETSVPQPTESFSPALSSEPASPGEAPVEPEAATAQAMPSSEVVSMDAPAASAPQDEEVMAALQNLIPAAGSENGSAPAHGNGDLHAAVASENSSSRLGRPRWIAEEAALTPDEAALSLEQEMEKAYAAFAASEAARVLSTSSFDGFDASATAPAGLDEMPATISEPHHLASFATAVGAADAVFASGDRGPGPENTRFQEIAAAAAAQGVSSASVSPEPVAPAPPAQEPEPGAAESVAHSSTLPDQSHTTQSAPEAAAAEEAGNFEVVASAGATTPGSQDQAIASQAIDPAISSSTEAISSDVPVSTEPAELVAAPAEAVLDNTDAGGSDSMGKNEGLGFKMIRQSPAGNKPASGTSVTKENFDQPKADDSPKAAEPAAMAAAASAESAPAPAPAPAGAPDPRAIASIVDSVLAELRPKIVEEIAKKLADPHK